MMIKFSKDWNKANHERLSLEAIKSNEEERKNVNLPNLLKYGSILVRTNNSIPVSSVIVPENNQNQENVEKWFYMVYTKYGDTL